MLARVYKGAQNHQRKKLSVREKTSHVQEKESTFNECKRRRQHTIGKQRRQRRPPKKLRRRVCNEVTLETQKR
jgi:hypothetical protein